MAELADGTGGTYLHNNNDLENGLKTLAASPQWSTCSRYRSKMSNMTVAIIL